MKFWWVNQSKTYQEEQPGGYMWSPKKTVTGSSNRFYENMAKCQTGDLVFAYYEKGLKAIGLISREAISARKPEFETSNNWSNDGWLVEVVWSELKTPIESKKLSHLVFDHINGEELRTPFAKNGKPKEGYLLDMDLSVGETIKTLTESSNDLSDLIGSFIKNQSINASPEEKAELNLLNNQKQLSDSEKTQTVLSRVGQGIYKSNLKKVESKCRFTNINTEKLLIASHSKPWAHCKTYEERIDGNNGLLLTPTYDKLYNDGFISFEDDGNLIISDQLNSQDAMTLNLQTGINFGSFSPEQQLYIRYHREYIFKAS